jgi:hypothetical protein
MSEAMFPCVENALHTIRPGTSWSVVYSPAGDWELDWRDEAEDRPSDHEIEECLDDLRSLYERSAYRSERAAAYPSIADQLDMLYWDQANGTNTWADAIASVKARFPKPDVLLEEDSV